MKSNKLHVSLLPCAFLALSLTGMTTLKDVTKPYIGTYECRYIMLGEENLLEHFRYVNFSLLSGGIYKIEFCDENKVKGLYRGHYTFDEREGLVTIDENIFGKKVSKSFPAENGVIDVAVQYGGKLLFVKFEMR